MNWVKMKRNYVCCLFLLFPIVILGITNKSDNYNIVDDEVPLAQIHSSSEISPIEIVFSSVEQMKMAELNVGLCKPLYVLSA